jgi:hypothetical protein
MSEKMIYYKSQKMLYASNVKNSRIMQMFLAFIILALPACNGQVKQYSNQPTATSSLCLVGIWSIRHPETFYRYTLPPGSLDQNNLTFKDSGGGIGYRFDENGVLTIEAVDFTGKFDAKDGADILPLLIKINGVASGSYKLGDGTVSLDRVLSSEIYYTARYAEETMMATNKVSDFSPLFLPAYPTAKFECNAEKLTLQIENFPGYQEKIEFERITQ